MQILDALEKRPYIIILLLVVLVSIFSLNASFLFIDDNTLIVNNPRLQFSLKELLSLFTKPLGQIHDAAYYKEKFIYYRPALNLLYMFNNSIWGINPVGFHITNLFLHMLTAMFIYRTGLILFNNDRIVCLIAASLFSVHPVHNELIGRVAMNENLVGFFIIVSLYFYLKKHKYISLAAFSFALLSKESAVMFLFVLFVFEIRCQSMKKTVAVLAPFITALGVYLVVRTIVVGIPDGIQTNSNWLESVLTSCAALSDYIRLLIFPYPLSLFYPVMKLSSLSQPDILISVLIFILLVYVIWKLRTDSLLFPLLLGVVLMLAPVVFKANELRLWAESAYIAERQLYVPAIFFSLLITGIIMNYCDCSLRKYVIVAVICLIPVFMYSTISMSAVWANDDVLLARFIHDYPHTSFAHNYQGQIFFARGDLNGAMLEFKKTLPTAPSQSIRLAEQIYSNADRKLLHINALSPDKPLLKQRKNPRGLADLSAQYDLAAYQPVFANVHYNMGQVYLAQNNRELAIKKFHTALALQPHLLEARTSLAAVYLAQGAFKDAQREYRIALYEIHRDQQR